MSPSNERLQELLEQPVVPWDKLDKLSILSVSRSKRAAVLALIVSKYPPKQVFEKKLMEWANGSEQSEELQWSNLIFTALSEPSIDIELLKIYFQFLEEQGCHLIDIDTYILPTYRNICVINPTNLKCLLSFMSGGDSDTKTLVHWLLTGVTDVSGGEDTLWDNHTVESWDRLQAIVHGMNVDASNSTTTFLEKYLKTLFFAYGFDYAENEEHFLKYAVNVVKWNDHLQLVATFAPDLFMEQNESTGNNFLNRILSLKGSYCKVIHRALECNVDSVHTPNNQGRSPLGIILQNLTNPSSRSGAPIGHDDCLKFCYHIAKKRPSPLNSGTAVSAVENIAPFLLFVAAFITMFTNYRHNATEKRLDRVLKIGKAFINRVTDDCCNTIVDRSGNTGLHIAIEHVGNSQPLLRPFERLLRRILKRLMTSRSTLTRNKDGKLPIDLALEGKKRSLICMALVKHSPILLEYRNPESRLYPFQMMASLKRISTCYSLLRMAPHLVSTALTKENTAFLRTKECIEWSRIDLDLERELTIRERKVKDVKQQIKVHKRKRVERAERLEEMATKCARYSA